MSKISVVINTRNEEKNIKRAIESVDKLADEIIVVDMQSTDETVKIAKKLGAKTYKYKQVDYVEPARNFAIEKAKNDWVLVLDADEKIPISLSSKLKKLTKDKKIDFYRLPRKNIIFGKWIKHSRWWPDYNVRFFKKDAVTWGDIIHSVPTTRGEGRDLEAKKEFAIIHHHYETIEQYIDRMNRYTTLHAKLKIEEGYEFEWADLVKKPVGEFLSRYFFGKGYKDGIHGLALAALQGFSELSMYLKIWQSKGFIKKDIDVVEVSKTFKQAQSDINFWKAEVLVKERGGIIYRIKRKLRLP